VSEYAFVNHSMSQQAGNWTQLAIRLHVIASSNMIGRVLATATRRLIMLQIRVAGDPPTNTTVQ